MTKRPINMILTLKLVWLLVIYIWNLFDVWDLVIGYYPIIDYYLVISKFTPAPS